MAYSNGYNLTTVLAKLFGRLAWRTDSTLNTANKTSASGRYFDDGSFHSLVTVDNVKKTVASQSDWDAFFTVKQNGVIARSLNGVFNGPEFFEQVDLYERTEEQEAEITNTGKAVGYKIEVVKDFDRSVIINSLNLYFNEIKTFNVYLFKQGSATPLQTKSVTTAANTKTTVDLSGWVLNYHESAVYYVVYFQDDLGTAKAINEQSVSFNKTLMFCAQPFVADTTGTIFTRTGLPLTNQPNGMNMQVSSFRDYTQNILSNASLFDELLGLTMAYQCLEEVVYAVRSNVNERILKEAVDRVGFQLDLNGVAPISDSPQVMGLKQRIDRELARVKKAFYPKKMAQTVNLAEC